MITPTPSDSPKNWQSSDPLASSGSGAWGCRGDRVRADRVVTILITGLSTRAIAESAVQGGYRVVTLDYFGDRDQKELVANYSLMRDSRLNFGAKALLVASRNLSFQAVVYTSNLENHPDVVEDLARGRVLLGNSPSTLRQVRDSGHLRSVCRREDIAHPVTLLPGEESLAEGVGCWVSRPSRSGGGHGIRPWAGELLDEDHVLQAYVQGRPASAAFVADGRSCVLLGLTEQLIGRRELGAQGFIWCGNILSLSVPASERRAVLGSVRATAENLTRTYGLRGVNGVDFVLGRDESGRPVPYLLEVNPRYSASMELVEWAYGLSIFDLHVRSFSGDLPSFSLEDHVRQPGFYGKAIVYAREDVVLPETAGWRAKQRRDIPFPGEQIEARRPICTVLAQGESRDDCWRRLLGAAEAVYRELTSSGGGCRDNLEAGARPVPRVL